MPFPYSPLPGIIWGLTNSTAICIHCLCGPKLVPIMTKNNRNGNYEVLIKFVAPEELKRDLQALADERNITLSALLRLITSEYAKRNNHST